MVDPVAFADNASAILRSAWRPPCLEYTPEYLRYQFGFPNSCRSVGVSAWEGEDPVGFVGAAPRDSNIGEVYLSSFLAVRSGALPSVSVGMIRVECREVLKQRRPTLVFAQVASVGEYLLRAAETLGLSRYPIGEYRVHSALPRAVSAGFAVHEEAPDVWAREADLLRDDSLLSPIFDSANLAHFRSEPCGRTFVTARHEGIVQAVAMLGWTQMLTTSGRSRIPALHYVRLRGDNPEALGALIAHAAAPEQQVVSVPNTVRISPTVAKAAGLRATGSVFGAYLCPNYCTVPSVRATEFEIV